PEVTLRIVCSKGTYIRAIARDLGEALGSGAHLVGLRRTRVGSVRVEECLTVEEAVEKIENAEITYPDDFRLPVEVEEKGPERDVAASLGECVDSDKNKTINEQANTTE
ncbi:MAG: hypothetical protein K2J49_04885, partial [Muribaculaceae bacterium]|nr:hypothetical protein [Muribaculaceae bacterium]